MCLISAVLSVPKILDITSKYTSSAIKTPWLKHSSVVHYKYNAKKLMIKYNEKFSYKNEKKTTALMHKNLPIGFIGLSASALAR